VLVTCQAGMNRSGLVTGLVLDQITDWSTERVVRAIRTARSRAAADIGYPRALHNPSFVDAIARHNHAHGQSPGHGLARRLSA
jgi:protein-tyrosine phosphatase